MSINVSVFNLVKTCASLQIQRFISSMEYWWHD